MRCDGSSHVKLVVIKRKHIGDDLFWELVEDPSRYADTNPFDDVGGPWYENQQSQDLRRALVQIMIADARDGKRWAVALRESEFVAVIPMGGSCERDASGQAEPTKNDGKDE